VRFAIPQQEVVVADDGARVAAIVGVELLGDSIGKSENEKMDIIQIQYESKKGSQRTPLTTQVLGLTFIPPRHTKVELLTPP